MKLVSNQFHTQIDTLGVCYVHKAHSALWVHDVIVVIDDILAIQPSKMATVEMVMMFLYIGLLWLRQQQRKRSIRARRRIIGMRRRIAAFRVNQERDMMNFLAVIATNQMTLSTMQHRSLWMRRRSSEFMEIANQWDDLQWKKNFRVSKPTFVYLCNELRTSLQRSDTVRASVSVEKRVAIALWRLGTNIEYRSLSNLVGVGASTACIIVHEVCDAIVRTLLKKYIYIPVGNEAIEIVEGFKEKWGFPQCFGAIDGSHIPILPPENNPRDYYNRKGFHSVVLQALVDHEYRFMNVYVGWPGSVHDARILSNSTVFDRGQAGTLVPNSVKVIGGVPVPVGILGDPAYPLLPWLVKTYPGIGLSDKQKKFNQRHCRARVVVECAFGRLKGRWRSLLKRYDSKVEFLSTHVTACCILHNVCEVHKDTFNEHWLDDTVQQSSNFTSASSSSTLPSSATAIGIRNALCEYFESH